MGSFQTILGCIFWASREVRNVLRANQAEYWGSACKRMFCSALVLFSNRQPMNQQQYSRFKATVFSKKRENLIFHSWNFATLIVLLLIPLFYFALNLFGIIQDLWIWILKKLACCHITLHIKLQQSAITCFQIIFNQMFSDDCITYLTQGIRRCWLEQIKRGENKTSEAAIQSL